MIGVEGPSKYSCWFAKYSGRCLIVALCSSYWDNEFPVPDGEKLGGVAKGLTDSNTCKRALCTWSAKMPTRAKIRPCSHPTYKSLQNHKNTLRYEGLKHCSAASEGIYLPSEVF